MNRRNHSNPGGLGFVELMLCPDNVFAQVCREIEAEDWQQARALLKLAAAPSRDRGGTRQKSGKDRRP